MRLQLCRIVFSLFFPHVYFGASRRLCFLIVASFYIYSQTCVKQAPKGKAKSSCLRQVFAYTGKFKHIWPLCYSKSWSLNTRDCLIQVAFKTGFTVCISVILLFEVTVVIYTYLAFL